jgi:hypothetical protein
MRTFWGGIEVSVSLREHQRLLQILQSVRMPLGGGVGVGAPCPASDVRTIMAVFVLWGHCVRSEVHMQWLSRAHRGDGVEVTV